ncbi:PBP1 [Sanghuangporus sanghuang]
MATVRKGGPLKKGPDSNQGSPAPGRRTPAWSNRASPSPGPAFNANSRGPANGFPPLGSQANGKATPNAWGSTEDKQQLLANLAGSINQTIIVTQRGNIRHEGTLTFVSPSATDDASLTLKNAKDLSAPNAPPKETLKIPASTVLSFSPGSSGTGTMSKVHDSFRTDAEISRTGSAKRERELQAWQPDSSDIPSNPAGNGIDNSHVDDVTFGPGASSGGQWDQFAVNERLFGVRTNFDEEEYTTRLDRNAKDYKERERRAEQIAAEITGSTTNNNPHIAEERGLAVDDSGVNEEDKYGAVVRGTNAYVPPGARRQATGNDVATSPPVKGPDKENKENQGKPEAPVPKVSIYAPDGSDKPPARTNTTTPGNSSAKQPADAVPAFRDFVTNEKQRLTQKKQALVKNEMEKRVAELVKFSHNFKLNKPIPDDLVPILAKDEEKQRQIREKSTQDAQSAKARTIGVSSSVLAATAQQKAAAAAPSARSNEPARKASAQIASSLKPSERVSSSKSSNALQASAIASTSAPAAKPNGNGKLETSKTMPRISMVIQPIPPFRGGKKQSSGDPKSSSASTSSQPLSPTSQQRLNVNATSFRPNPKAPAFTPTGSTSPKVQAQAVSPKPRQEPTSSAPPTPNLFFGTQVIKKTPPVNVKEDFNSFKSGKVQDAKSVGPNWPYTGKRYMHVLPPPPAVTAPPPQASPHMAPHGPPPPPPPSYDEDAAAQAQAAAATRGYAVYAYAPYYPGQPMMAGMAGVPPGAFIPSPYMQPMPYPPNMHHPNGQPMYAPPHMAQMPPPQQYMPPPPPGAYPPPPGSTGPRPSMPPTPIPAHAHPYYHQSPQLQHAMPYPMMIPPPAPNAPPHPYETGPPPPVPMGGVGHA